MTTIDDKDPPVKKEHSPEARAKAGATRRAKKAAADAATAAAEQGRRVRPDEEYALPSGKTLLWGDFEKCSLDALLLKDGDQQIVKLLQAGNALSTAVVRRHRPDGHRYYPHATPPNPMPANTRNDAFRPRLTGRAPPAKQRRITLVRFLPGQPLTMSKGKRGAWHLLPQEIHRSHPPLIGYKASAKLGGALDILGRLKDRS